MQSRFHGTRTMPYTPVSCGTGHSFRDTRTLPHAHWGKVCQRESTSIKRERPLELCSGHKGERCSRDSEAERDNERDSREAEGRSKGAVEPRKLSNRGRETEMHR